MQERNQIGQTPLDLFLKLKTKGSNTLSLVREGRSDPISFLKRMIANSGNWPESIQVIDLRYNNLSRCSNALLLRFLDALPDTVLSVDLSHNNLLNARNSQLIDGTLQMLGKTRFKGKVNLSLNGESDLTRAICPMISLARQYIGFDLAFTLLACLSDNPLKPDFFRQRLLTILVKQDNVFTMSLIDTRYRQFGGSFFKTAILFKANEREKIALLQGWSENNPKDAARETLCHFGL